MNPKSQSPKPKPQIPPLRATHLITTLDADGAQLNLARLLRQLGDRAAAMDVISLAPEGPVGELLREGGIRVRSLGMQGGRHAPAALFKLAQWLRRARPSVLVTWLYHANFLGSLASRLTGGPPIVWNVAHSTFEPRHGKRHTRLVVRVSARLARRTPQQVVFCSARSRELHCRHGYPAERATLIPNGFDLEQFRPSPTDRREIRRELEIPENAPLIGIVGRFHPDKDHATFAAAAGPIARRRPDVHFLLCGRGCTAENGPLVHMLQQSGALSRCRLLGSRSDIPRVMAALDVYASSSATEAFPLVLGEAMASGVPCVATDVGDCAYLLADTGRLVPPRGPLRLAHACLDLLELPSHVRAELGRAARRRVAQHFDLPSVAERHLAVWSAAAGVPSLPQPILPLATSDQDTTAAA